MKYPRRFSRSIPSRKVARDILKGVWRLVTRSPKPNVGPHPNREWVKASEVHEWKKTAIVARAARFQKRVTAPADVYHEVEEFNSTQEEPDNYLSLGDPLSLSSNESGGWFDMMVLVAFFLTMMVVFGVSARFGVARYVFAFGVFVALVVQWVGIMAASQGVLYITMNLICLKADVCDSFYQEDVFEALQWLPSLPLYHILQNLFLKQEECGKESGWGYVLCTET